MQNNGRILAAELVGTAVLMLGGPGIAILAGGDASGRSASRSAFGFSLLIMAYVIGPISGCHINPAVTLAMLLARKINGTHAVFCVDRQWSAAIGGAAIIYGIASGLDDFERGNSPPTCGHWPGGYGLGSTIVVEVVFTALLVLVVLSTTTRSSRRASAAGRRPHAGADPPGHDPGRQHVGEPGSQLRPAHLRRRDSDALRQLWAFIVFPLIGAVVGVIVWLMIDDSRLEDTMVYDPVLVQARDMATNAIDEVVEEIDDVTDGKD